MVLRKLLRKFSKHRDARFARNQTGSLRSPVCGRIQHAGKGTEKERENNKKKHEKNENKETEREEEKDIDIVQRTKKLSVSGTVHPSTLTNGYRKFLILHCL